MDFCFVKGCNAEQYKVSLDILDAVPEVLVVGMASLWTVSSLNSFCVRSVRAICCWGCFCFASSSEL